MYTRENAPLTPEQRKHLDNVLANSRIEGYEITSQNLDDVIRIILGKKPQMKSGMRSSSAMG